MNKIFILLILTGLAFIFVSNNTNSNISAADVYTKTAAAMASTSINVFPTLPKLPEPPKHLATPNPLRAVYMSSWTAGSPDARDKIIQMIDETEINAVVIDVKDSTGAVSFNIDDPFVQKINPSKNRIPDIDKLISLLHKKNIYVIARIAVFEDPILANARPDLAVQTKSGAIWKDNKGLSWTDMGSKEVWDYNIAIAKGAYKAGFDELNFDYVRFPSDGDMNNIAYPSLAGKKLDRPEELGTFFHYLSDSMLGVGVPLSLDMFGMTTTNTDDLNIGQVLENAVPYFDYIDPMVYPSHYPDNFHGYSNPAAVPYDLIKYVMSEGVKRMNAASSSPDKLRPWLQDFNLGADYTAPMVRAEIRATYDAGLSSWLLWNAANRYTDAALEKN